MLLFPDAGHEHRAAVASRRQLADFSECEVIVEERIVNQRLTAAPIEPRSGAAYWTDDGRLVHYSACQGAHPTKDLLAGIYGLDPATGARRSCPTSVGGSARSHAPIPEELAIGFYARAVGRPVKWTETRSENMVAMPQGRGQVQRAKLGGTRDGRITAYHLDVVARRRGVPAHRRHAPDDDDADGDRRLRDPERVVRGRHAR